MDCEKAEEVLYLVFDKDFEEDLRRGFQAHVSSCPGCAQHHSFTQKLFILVRQRVVRYPAPARLRTRILTSLRNGSWTRK